MKVLVNNLSELDILAGQIFQKLRPGSIILLYGELGSGKTTLVQHLGKLLRVKSTINSPTFNLMNQYVARLNEKFIEIFHLDLFRLDNNDSLIDLNFADLSRGRPFMAFVEWPDRVDINWHNIAANVYSIFINIKWDKSIDRENSLDKIPRVFEFKVLQTDYNGN